MWSHIDNLACLSVADLPTLHSLVSQIADLNVNYVTFIEPDYGDELTAVAIQAGEDVGKLLSTLPLALKEYKT